MTFQNLETVTVVVFVLVAFILAQAFVFLVILMKLDQEIKRLEKGVAKYGRELKDLMGAVDDGLSHLEGVFRTLPSAQKHLSDMLESILAGAGIASQSASERIESAVATIDEATRQFDFMLTKFSRQTSRVRRAVRYPTISAAALVHGLATALRSMRTPKRKPMRHLHDGESFI